MTEPKPHSADFFTDSRDYWWNADFIALMARRWDLSGVSRVLDVGCGLGHWGRALSRHLPAEAHILGVDREPKWVARAADLTRNLGLSSRHEFREGSAQDLPFDAESFDLVTCQTVLIHVPNPRQVLAEMLRVLRPGGLLMVAEPNNLANTLVGDSASFDSPPEESLGQVRLQLLCERGKQALGEGNNSVGGQIPGFLMELGLESIQVYLSDKASKVLAPYAEPEQPAIVFETIDRAGREFWLWERQETRRYFLAGGGREDEFEDLWQLAGRRMKATAAQMQAGTYVSPGGQVTYLVSGRKPAGR